MKDWKCKYCESVFKTRAELRQHVSSHNLPRGGGRPAVNWTCCYCGCNKNSPLASKTLHEKCCIKNPNRVIRLGHKQTEETKKKISETGRKNKLMGGYRYGSGRGKKGTYKGYYCDSSWELAYVIYNLDHDIHFERNEQLFPYEYNGKQHKYKPDFIEGNTYIEIKGYFTKQVKAKEEAFPFKLKYIDKNGIKPYMSYVVEKYGENYISLYEDKTYDISKRKKRPKAIKPKPTPRICQYCGKPFLRFEKHEKLCFLRMSKRKEPFKETLSKRKDLILNSGVDMMKFGWVSKMEKVTGLSKHQIEDCVRYFSLEFFKRSSAL